MFDNIHISIKKLIGLLAASITLGVVLLLFATLYMNFDDVVNQMFFNLL